MVGRPGDERAKLTMLLNSVNNLCELMPIVCVIHNGSPHASHFADAKARIFLAIECSRLGKHHVCGGLCQFSCIAQNWHQHIHHFFGGSAVRREFTAVNPDVSFIGIGDKNSFA